MGFFSDIIRDSRPRAPGPAADLPLPVAEPGPTDLGEPSRIPRHLEPAPGEDAPPPPERVGSITEPVADEPVVAPEEETPAPIAQPAPEIAVEAQVAAEPVVADPPAPEPPPVEAVESAAQVSGEATRLSDRAGPEPMLDPMPVTAVREVVRTSRVAPSIKPSSEPAPTVPNVASPVPLEDETIPPRRTREPAAESVAIEAAAHPEPPTATVLAPPTPARRGEPGVEAGNDAAPQRPERAEPEEVPIRVTSPRSERAAEPPPSVEAPSTDPPAIRPETRSIPECKAAAREPTPEPRVHIGQIDVVVMAPQTSQGPVRAAEPNRALTSSRYLRSL